MCIASPVCKGLRYNVQVIVTGKMSHFSNTLLELNQGFLLFALAGEEFQVMQHFTQQRLWLFLDAIDRAVHGSGFGGIKFHRFSSHVLPAFLEIAARVMAS